MNKILPYNWATPRMMRIGYSDFLVIALCQFLFTLSLRWSSYPVHCTSGCMWLSTALFAPYVNCCRCTQLLISTHIQNLSLYLQLVYLSPAPIVRRSRWGLELCLIVWAASVYVSWKSLRQQGGGSGGIVKLQAYWLHRVWFYACYLELQTPGVSKLCRAFCK